MSEETDSIDQLIAEAELGEEAKTFLEGDLGKYLMGLAEQEIWIAQEALERVDPSDHQKIMALQNQAKFGRMFKQELVSLVEKGDSAFQVLKQQKEAA